ncbi:uncharacterized protein LOC133197035 [Saccostrea echinata]|uniref:uncharacterized protein LOC133197035 n=1 Tax=Saccostrea echinata TaxID=191078 RepID=UPI002A8149C1|nr:uncharacterized protein LOC133197035 [Saccostrea echinata]
MDSNAQSLIESALQHISESVFVGLCHIVGTSQQVAMRREVLDITEKLTNQVNSDSNSIMTSGSYREGLRLKGSDIDIMYWRNYERVIWDLSQTRYYNRHRYTLILCDCSDSPPGFCLLQLLITAPIIATSSCIFGIADINNLSTLVRTNGALFMSSKIYRETRGPGLTLRFTPHGPCASGIHAGLEYDFAYCFGSDFWPPPAASWIDRCHSWPQPHVVSDIIRSGCHFVATGHKLGNHEDHEWRISFSRAEQKLVYSMNHMQFLTYGLLKLFLKEVINNELGDHDKLLCSYHMKTSLFWVIQQNTGFYSCPRNLLFCFWDCFKLILQWVYEGFCPNFFIPQNNMFLSSIHGDKQNQLFIRLHALYEKGLVSLLHSTSIWPYVLNVLCNPMLPICTDESNLFPEIVFDLTLFNCLTCAHVKAVKNLYHCKKALEGVEQLINTPLTPYHVVTLQKHTTSFLQNIAFILHNMYIKTCRNKMVYIADRMSHRILILTSKFGCPSDMVYTAMYYYKTMRFLDALSVIEMTKFILSYKTNTEALRGQSLTSKMRLFKRRSIFLNNYICYINELLPEQLSSIQESQSNLAIPVFVLLYILEILCYSHVDTTKVQTALCYLQHLVHHPHRKFIPEGLEDISWQILGICYQVTGNPHAALYAYQQSLSQVSVNKIKHASLMRIQDILQ